MATITDYFAQAQLSMVAYVLDFSGLNGLE
jgi:hypothetical protein